MEARRLDQTQEMDMALVDIIRAEKGEGDDDDDEDDSDPLAGFYYPPDYVLMTWQEKRNHGILPEPGGLNDQDWRLVFHDWPLLNQRYNRLMELLYPSDGSDGEVYEPVQLPVTEKNLTGLMD